MASIASGDLEAAFGERAQRHRPAPGGVLIGAVGAPVGSLGCLVRDNTDDSLQILSAATLVTYGGSLPVGTQIYQPASAAHNPVNLVGTVTRSTTLARSPLLYPTLSAPTPSVDAAIVRPTSDNLVTDATADRMVPPAHKIHPMVALIVGLTRPAGPEAQYVAIPISSVLTALNVRPLREDAVSTVSVGRSVSFVAVSGTKRGTVIDVGATIDVPCAHPDGPSVVRIEDAIVIDAGYAELIDVGSVVHVWRGNEVASRCSGCAIALELEQAYELPFVANVDLADRIRDDYLLETVTGQMLVQLFYKNEATFRARVMGAAPTQSELDYARLIYDRYARMVRSEIDEVSVTRVPVTEDVLEDVRASIYGLSRFMTHPEYDACQQLLDLLEEVRDFSIQDGIDYMNLETTRARVHAIIQGVPGWDTSYAPD